MGGIVPVHYEFDHEARIAIATVEGSLDGEACLRAISELAENREFDPGYSLLGDWRGGEYTGSLREASDVAEAFARVFAGAEARIAAVSSSPRFYEFATLTGVYLRKLGSVSEVFSDPDRARRWLLDRDAA